jgi:putative ABC transport system permease protein
MQGVLDVFLQTFTLVPLVLAIYISYEVMKITDLTVEGSFVLGAAVYAKLIIEAINPVLAFVIAILAGLIAGIVVGCIQRHDKIDSLIAGILMIFMLYSINLQIMGSPNLTTYNHETMLTYISYAFADNAGFIFAAFYTLFCIVMVYILLNIQLGLRIRAYGDNKHLLYRLGCNPEKYRITGLAFSNALAAGSGALTCQIYGFTDINMGFGIALTAIAAWLLGVQTMRKIFRYKNFSVKIDCMACLLGALLYYSAVTFLLKIGVDPINLKLLIGLVLVILLKIMSNKKRKPWEKNF